MGEQQPVLFDLDEENGVATIVLNRPKRGNALNPGMQHGVMSFLEKIENNPLVHVLVLTGRGKYFCTGMDLGASNQNALQAGLDEGKENDPAKKGLEFFERISTFPKPVIGRANGPAFGGGVGLLLCCDFRIMPESSFLCFSEVKRGIVPALISYFILQQATGFHVKRHMLLGDRFSAAVAQQEGMVSDVVADVKELDAVTNRYVNELRSSAPQAMSSVKSLVRFQTGHSAAENREHVQSVFRKTVHSPEAMYGIGAFAQKQKPDWRSFHCNQAKL